MARQVIQTTGFAREAADFIVSIAHAALEQRGEFRNARHQTSPMFSTTAAGSYPLILAAHEICFLVNSNKSASLIERVFVGDESLHSTLVDRDAERMTWILGKAS